MKTLALILVLGFKGVASAGYNEAEAAAKYLGEHQMLDALLVKSGAALIGDAGTGALLTDNRAALELFRQAAEERNDGSLFGSRPEKLNSTTPMPKYGVKTKLFKLLLIDAKVKMAQRQRGPAEKDLLAAAGFLAQVSEQKSGLLMGSLVQQMCLLKSYPVLSDSLRGASADAAYLSELAARLDKIINNQDFMRATLLEEAEMEKGSIRESVTPASAAAERIKLPFWKRAVGKKLMDREFFSTVYGRFDAVSDARAAVLISAFRANDPAVTDAFIKKQQQVLQARKEARGKRGFWTEFKDGLKGGPVTKMIMAEVMTDTLLDIAPPSYGKLIARFHVSYCALNVLRSALAVKFYQRMRKRLPDSLDQLVPAYLPAVPRDSFNKFGPVRYIRTGKKFSVYSFGPDGSDENGAAALDYEAYAGVDGARAAGDIVFSD